MKIVEISSRKNMLKLDNGTNSSWYKINASNTVGLELAQTLAVGEEVDVNFTVINGVSVLGDIKKIEASAPSPAVEKTVVEEKVEAKVEIGTGNNFDKPAAKTGADVFTKPSGTFSCNKCGKALKDDKYENCYTCNQEEWKKSGGSKTQSTGESIQRQAVGKMTARTVAAIVENTPTLVLEDVLNLIDNIYDKFEEKVKG